MTATAILCSGQGAQNAGMFDLLADAIKAAPVFEAAKAVLGGRDPRDVVRTATPDELDTNRTAQILCCVQALAAWEELSSDLPRPVIVAGYSIGELAAWGVAGLLDIGSVLELAAARAQAMDDATTEPTGLVAVQGIDARRLARLCERHQTYVAIINGSDQRLIGGTDRALAAFVSDARAEGARHVSRVRVAVASHTPLLRPASEIFRATLRERIPRVIVPEDVRLLSGVDGDFVYGDPGREKLADQICQTLDWAACMETCRSLGVRKLIEFGPGSALANMTRGQMPGSDVHGMSEFRSLDGIRRWLQATRS